VNASNLMYTKNIESGSEKKNCNDYFNRS